MFILPMTMTICLKRLSDCSRQISFLDILLQISGIMEQHIVPSLPHSPADIAAMRCYLTLPWCHLFDEPETFENVICPFGQAILALQKAPSRILGGLPLALAPDEFQHHEWRCATTASKKSSSCSRRSWSAS